MTPRTPLYMVRLSLELTGLVGLGRRRRLPLRQVDLGYITHIQLAETFGDRSPKPFVASETGNRWLTVLAYTDREPAELRETAQACADPAVYAAVDWEKFAAKPMPVDWPAERQFGFEVRTCPTVRMASDGEHHRKGVEVDAFLAACWKAGSSTSVDRESVYRDWLTKRLEAEGAVVRRCGLHRFQLDSLLRRTQGEARVGRLCQRPVATLRGTLEIKAPVTFSLLLRRGIGRHRAFGFGMVLLHPRGRGRC
jgi:CRISPR system Cascade subunit CasE